MLKPCVSISHLHIRVIIIASVTLDRIIANTHVKGANSTRMATKTPRLALVKWTRPALARVRARRFLRVDALILLPVPRVNCKWYMRLCSAWRFFLLMLWISVTSMTATTASAPFTGLAHGVPSRTTSRSRTATRIMVSLLAIGTRTLVRLGRSTLISRGRDRPCGIRSRNPGWEDGPKQAQLALWNHDRMLWTSLFSISGIDHSLLAYHSPRVR